MPIDIEGWIEIKSENSQEWLGKVCLSEYLILADANSDYIFGITKRPSLDSIAGNRGLPKDISLQVTNNLDSYRAFEKEESNFSFDELFGFSFITYYEILELDLLSNIDSSSQWVRVFESMQSFQNDGFGERNIRIIVWANW